MPGPASNSVPSAISTWIVPETWYWKCGASQRAVPAIGLTWVDQRQPGSRTSRPTVPASKFNSSTRPFSKVRTSFGRAKSLCSVIFMACPLSPS